MLGKVLDLVVADARGRWASSAGTVRAGLTFVAIGTVLVFGSLAHRPFFRFLTREDSVLEWLQFAAFVTACPLALLTARNLMRHGDTIVAAMFVVAGLSTFGIAAEEISWGQRIFDIDTPEGLRVHNEQEEITLHNIDGVLDTIDLGMLAVAAFGTIAPLVALRRRFPTFWDWATPPAYLVPMFATMAGYRLARLTVLTSSRFVVNRLGEWAEVCLAVALFAFMGEALRRSVREESPAARS
jgi:hypothetical protein